MSLANPEPEIRLMAPHTLVYTGTGWYVQAYCEKNRDYRDFVLNRFRGPPHVLDTSEHGCEEDAGWSTEAITRY